MYSAVGTATLAAVALLGAAHFQPSSAQEEAERMGLTWISAGDEYKDCLILAGLSSPPENTEPRLLTNPFSGNGYAVGRWEDCPREVDGTKVTTFDRYTVRDGAVRLYAPWGRVYIFRHFPYARRLGYQYKYRFKWIPPEEF